MSKRCPKCQYLVGAPLLSSTAFILLAMEFTRAAQVVAGILHNDITELLDVRYMVTRLYSANCLQAFLWASFRRGFLLGWSKPTCWSVCGVWSELWQADLPLLQPLKKCRHHTFVEVSFCTWRTAQGLNFFDRPLRGLFRVKPVLENLCMTLATVL